MTIESLMQACIHLNAFYLENELTGPPRIVFKNKVEWNTAKVELMTVRPPWGIDPASDAASFTFGNVEFSYERKP